MGKNLKNIIDDGTRDAISIIISKDPVACTATKGGWKEYVDVHFYVCENDKQAELLSKGSILSKASAWIKKPILEIRVQNLSKDDSRKLQNYQEGQSLLFDVAMKKVAECSVSIFVQGIETYKITSKDKDTQYVVGLISTITDRIREQNLAKIETEKNKRQQQIDKLIGGKSK